MQATAARLRMRRALASQNAFSLVELAVVLAILGIIVGTAIATSSYLNTARRSTVINEGKFYQSALKQFQQKYGGALPGDMGNATEYWPQSAACPTTGAPGTACNGNGNGQIAIINESFYAFRHLQLAGLISGNYSGNGAGAGPFVGGIINQNVPGLAMDGVGGYYSQLTADGYVATSASHFGGFYGVAFEIGKEAANKLPNEPFLKPNEMQQLDAKFDDGRADGGWIRPNASETSCVSGTNYLINGDIGCHIIMLQN